MKRVGVLALQGDFDAHLSALADLGAEGVPVRTAAEIDRTCGLILPGGESTTLLKLLREESLMKSVIDCHRQGRPLFGTCAGAILLARRVTGPEQESLGLLDIEIQRNAYGRQRDSFETSRAPASGMGEEPLEMVFIRAPRILACGPAVEILARHEGDPVLVRQDTLLAATFHPEMGRDRRVHAQFLEMAGLVSAAA